jgi:hypothetical protein
MLFAMSRKFRFGAGGFFERENDEVLAVPFRVSDWAEIAGELTLSPAK